MPLPLTPKPVERILFRSDIAAVAEFRCPAGDALFRDSGPCSNHTFVFPRTSTLIRRDDRTTIAASPNVVVFYNQHDRYAREAVSAIDATDWYVVADDVLLDAVAAFHPQVADDPRRPFRIPFAPIDTKTYVEQRSVFELAKSGTADANEIDERLMRLLSRALAAAYAHRPRLSEGARDAVVETQRAITGAPQRNTSLRELARATGTSPFHLSRAFRSFTGMTIASYRHSLRVRIALERLRAARSDLTALALDLGFSSHSHFTSVFRRHTGTTPSQYCART